MTTATAIIVHGILWAFTGFCVWFVHQELRRNGYEPISAVVAFSHRLTKGRYRFTTTVENWPDLGSEAGLFWDFLVRTDSFYGGLVSPGNHVKRFLEKKPLSWILIWKARRSLDFLKDENHIAMVGSRFRPLFPFREAMLSALSESEKVASSLLVTSNVPPSRTSNTSAEGSREKYLADMAESNLRIAQFSAAAAAASAIGSLLQVIVK